METCLENGSCIEALDVLEISEDLPSSPDAAIWNAEGGPGKITIDLGPQMITNPKWPDPSIKNVQISAVRNNSDIAVLLEWEDATLDNFYGHSERYTDQAAIMFPLTPKKEAPAITMGSEHEAVNIWQWKAVWEKDLRSGKKSGEQSRQQFSQGSSSNLLPDRASSVEDLNAEGFSTLTIQEHQDVRGKGVWQDNRWRVLFRRNLRTSDSSDAQINGSTQMAVAVWNGSNRERNGQKGLAGWILLRFR